MGNNHISEMLDTTITKIRDMADVNTIVGEPINTASGVTIIPVSKVSIGFGSGGSDFATKNQRTDSENAFGGGGGAGVSIVPVGFLVVNGTNVRLIPVDEPASTTLDRAIELIPELIDKVTTILEKKKNEKSFVSEEAD